LLFVEPIVVAVLEAVLVGVAVEDESVDDDDESVCCCVDDVVAITAPGNALHVKISVPSAARAVGKQRLAAAVAPTHDE